MSFCSLLITLFIAVTPDQNPLAPYRNLPVVEVNIHAPAGEQVDELKRLTGIAPGYLLSTSSVQTAIKRLYSLGRFAAVELYIEQRAQALVLHFVLKPVQQLGALYINGLTQSSSRAFIAALQLPVGSEIDRRTPTLLHQQAKNYLQRIGFPHATLSIDVLPITDNTSEISIKVDEGIPIRINAINFVGKPLVHSTILKRLIHTDINDILNLDNIEHDQNRLLQAYLEHGFAKVQIASPQITIKNNFAVVNFNITAGPRVALYFIGNQILSDNILKKLWPANTNTLQSGDFSIFKQRIIDAYRRLGYANAKISMRGYQDYDRHHHPIERYLFNIQEGSAISVTNIDFEGVSAFSKDILIQQIQNTLIQELIPTGSVQPINSTELALANGTRLPKISPPPAPEQRWVFEIYARACEDILAAYHDKGFLNATVGKARFEKTTEGAHVIIPVKEGVQTRVKSLNFIGNTAQNTETLQNLVKQTASQQNKDNDYSSHIPLVGTPLSYAGVEDTRIAIIRSYRDEGYLYANVFTDVKLSEDSTIASVSFRIIEGPQVRIDNVVIRGNHYTRTNLIKNRMQLKNGELYRLSQALQDQRNIADLGVFSSVRVRLVDEQTPAERKDIVTEVVERNRHAFELWPGVSTADGPRLRVDYSHLNLYGTATSLNISLKLNWKMFFGFYGEYAEVLDSRYENFSIRERTEIEAHAGIRLPNLTFYPVETGLRFDLVGERHNAIPYSFDAVRAIFGIDISFFRRLGITFEPQFSVTNLQCFPGTTQGENISCQNTLLTATPDRRRLDEGLRLEFKVGPTITLDFRDNAFNPTRGFIASARALYGTGATLSSQALNSISGYSADDWSRFNFSRIESNLAGYVPLGKSVLALSARWGTLLSGNVPLDERFYLGGSTTLRGFQETAMLADDVCIVTRSNTSPQSLKSHCVWRNRAYITSENGVYILPLPTGGNHYVLFKAEIRLPLTNELIFAMFADTGNLWLTKVAWHNMRLRTTPGVGLRYATPAGPIGIDVGFNPNADPYRSESTVNVQFAVGSF
ncbi:MAG: BamA/TamA family outer membrane protein [Deltaproteobacteria bacterium]|nr:BamA/TamA family outer membrane protein [Deltaproteobacteria bacterium]